MKVNKRKRNFHEHQEKLDISGIKQRNFQDKIKNIIKKCDSRIVDDIELIEFVEDDTGGYIGFNYKIKETLISENIIIDCLEKNLSFLDNIFIEFDNFEEFKNNLAWCGLTIEFDYVV